MFGRDKYRDPSLTWYPADDSARTRQIGGIVLATVCAVTGFVVGTLSASVWSPRGPEPTPAAQIAPAPAPETPKQAATAKPPASADVEQSAVATAGAMNAPPPTVAEKPAPTATSTATAPSPEEKPATNSSAGASTPASPTLLNPGASSTDKSAPASTEREKSAGPRRETRPARDRYSADDEASAMRQQRRERRARDRRPYPFYGDEEARSRAPGPPWGYGPRDDDFDRGGRGRDYQSLRDLMLGR